MGFFEYVVATLGVLMVGISIYELISMIRNNDPELDDFFEKG